jgi:class 3 adenylate cyclase/tetratricopeptide (TPR) repeat protein
MVNAIGMGETETFARDAVTVLFTDVEGSTELRTRRGDAAAQELLRAHEDLVRRLIAAHAGREVKHLGDGFMVAFSSARSAVECAVAIQRGLAEDDAMREVRIRIGLNTGEIVERAGDLFGQAVNAASRIAAKACGGQILVAPVVRDLAASAAGISFLDRGLYWLKGFPERWRLYEAMPASGAAAAAPVVAERTPFVGRDAERADLRRFLDSALGGRGAVVLIGGEPGVGKTRLAAEVALEAEERGVMSLVGHCYEMEGAPPYMPFVELLETTARRADPALFRAALGEDAGEVARLLPALRRTFDDIPPPLELPPEQERRYLFNSVSEFISRAARLRPLLLLLDDLHWADESTLLLLQHMAGQIADIPLLVVGTYRDVELDVRRPLAATLEDLLRRRLAHRVSLKRLSQEGVGAMLTSLAGLEAPPALVKAIHEETEGNPFFVEEVFRHLTEEGRLFDATGRWRSGLQIGELDVPEGVRLVIGRRLQRLGEEARRVLATAAVIGRGFGFSLLEALGEVETDTLLDAVDEAERAGLITSSSDGMEARFTFAHELIRQTLLTDLSLPRRQRLHLRIAEAIERAYAAALEDHIPDLAHHLYQAGAAADPAKTARFLTLAGDRAFAAAGFEDALRLYENAAALQPAEDSRAHAALLDKLGRALRALGRFEEALARWREALNAYEDLGDAETIGQLCLDMAYMSWWMARFEEVVLTQQRGLIATGDQGTPTRARLLAMSGAVLSMAGFADAAESMLADGLELSEKLRDQRTLGYTLFCETVHHADYMEWSQVVEVGTRAAELLRRSGALWDLAETLPWLAYGLATVGRIEEGVRVGEEAVSIAERVGHVGALLLARRLDGIASIVAGDIHGADVAAHAELELGSAIGIPWICQTYTWLGIVQLWRGRFEGALAHLKEGARLEPPGAWHGLVDAFILLTQAYAGRRDEALAILDARSAQFPSPGGRAGTGVWLVTGTAVESLALLGERGRAAELYPLALDLASRGALVRGWDYALTDRVAGIAAAAGEDWAGAEAHFRSAAALCDRLDHRMERPNVRYWYARMLAERRSPGDRERAREMLGSAADDWRRVGMPRHVELAEEAGAQI